MRVFVLALAILLLPLRGWLGDAMAMEMTQQQVVAAVTVVAHEAASAQDAHADHAMHDMASTADGMHTGHASHDPAAQPDCQSTCTDCQLCHSVAMTVWPEMPTTGEAPRATPSLAPVAFASAEPAPGFKPPIS